MSMIAFLMLTIVVTFVVGRGQFDPILGVIIIFTAAAISDTIGLVSGAVHKHQQLRNMEVILNGLAEGDGPQGLRNQVREAARKAWEQAQRDNANKDKAN